MMKNNTQTYKILAHCTLSQIRLGFEASVSSLPFATKVNYADLSADGIMSHLHPKPDLIVVLLSQCDSEFGLPLKIKLFTSRTPLLVVLPAIPERYHHALCAAGVDKVVELPVNAEELCREISELLNIKS